MVTLPTLGFKQILSSYFELAKPRISFLLMLTALGCYFLATPGDLSLWGALITLGAVGSSSVGIFALNHFMEHVQDALMARTKDRPIPSGRIAPWAALVFGLVFLSGSLVFCWYLANPLTALIAALVAFSYLLIYTPLKYKTPFHTALGALPGAAPPLAGWAVAQNALPLEAWILFLLMFLWQFPHFLAIEMMYKDDYAKAQVQVVPTVDPSGFHMKWQILVTTLLLFPTVLAPWYIGLSGPGYGILALAATGGFFYYGLRLIRTQDRKDARNLLRASVLYLPLIMGLLLSPL